MILYAASWLLLILGVAHTILGLVLFRKPFSDALSEGLIGRFEGVDSRMLAFWFTVFGPTLILGGHVCLFAVGNNDFELLRIIGYYVLAICCYGVVCAPKSPFWIALATSPILIFSGYGWF